MDFISSVAGLALVAVATVSDWLARLPGWLIPALIAVWMFENKFNAIEGRLTAILKSLDEVKSRVDGMETELAEVKSMMEDVKSELADDDDF